MNIQMIGTYFGSLDIFHFVEVNFIDAIEENVR